MSDRAISLQPVVRFPRITQPGGSYLLTIDLRHQIPPEEWPYEQEEYPLTCLLETLPLFEHRPLGEPTLLLHRFGGTYGEARFLLTAQSREGKGCLKILLVNESGLPLLTVELPETQVRVDARSKRFRSSDSVAMSLPASPADSVREQLPWRSGGTRRSWGGKHELPVLQSRLASANQPEFEKLARTLLRLALAPPDRLLGEEAFRSIDHGYVIGAGEAALPVFVQLVAFQERSEDLGEAHVLRCRDAIERFTKGALRPAVYLLVHNRDPRNPVFRKRLEREIAAFRTSGRVEHVLVWDARNLLEAAFDNLFDIILATARRGGLSVAPVESALASSADLLSEVPLRVSSLTADQHRLGADEETGRETVADPAALLLEAKPTVRTILLGGFGFGKTTVVARSLLREDIRVLYVPGASLTQEVGTAKVFLSHCVNADHLFADSSPSDREIYERMLRAVVEHLLKDESLPCALVIDGLDESPFLCRGAGLAHLLNNLETVRIPVVLSMRSEYWLSRSGDLQSTAGKLASRGEPKVRRLRKIELLPWRENEILLFVQRFREACPDPAERERLRHLESLVASGRFAEIYGDIPRRPLFLRLIAESAAAVGLPTQRIGRARLFRNWARWKIRRDLRVQRPHLVFDGEPAVEVQETAWQAMLWAAASMTQEHEGELEILPDCSFERIRGATPALERMVDVLALSLQSLLLLSEERSGVRQARVAFAHRAFQEFFLAWFLAEGYLDRNWLLPPSVQEWIRDLRQEGLLDPAARREAERPPGLPPPPERPLQWQPQETASRPKMPRAEPADLILHVLERPRGRRRLFDLRLTARDPGLDLRERPFGTIKLEADPADFFRQHLKEVATGDALRARGAFFAEQILPPDLRKTLSILRHQVQMLQIVSDDPWIPWEILRIEESPESTEVDGPFLCEAFALTRWLHPIRQTVYLPLSSIAAVVPRDSQLPYAEQEWEDLRGLSGFGRKVERIPARRREIEEAFRKGEHDGWHFTGHGLFATRAADLSEIWLEDEEKLTPADLGGEAKRMGVKRPLVFLNACKTGQRDLSLTEVGGWAPHFLRAGAGAFIGSLWPIGDSQSREFARVFYGGFTAGLPLGEAVQAARQAIRSQDDHTWLAYTVFAHPRAMCRPVPEALEVDLETVDPFGQVLAVLFQRDEMSPELAEQLWERLGQNEYRGAVSLLEAGLTITERVLAAWRTAGATPGMIASRRLVRAINNLGFWLRSLKRLEPALGKVEEALALSRDLAAQSGDAADPAYAQCLHNLATVLSDLGQTQRALPLMEEAVTLYRRLAAQDFPRYREHLASGIKNLGSLLCDLGLWDRALLPLQEAAEIHRALAAESISGFGSELAQGLHNLGVAFGELRRFQEAIPALEEAVRIRRELSLAKPGTPDPDLASSLHTLATALGDSSDPEAAVARLEEASVLRRRLAGTRPDVFEADLAGTLSSLGFRRRQAGQLEQALADGEEAVAIYRRLAKEEPQVFEVELASALHNLSLTLSSLLRRDEALAAAEESLALYRKILPERPGVCERELLEALLHAANLHYVLQRPAEALQLAEENLRLCRSVAANGPPIARRSVAQSLHNLGAIFRKLDRLPEAADATREAVSLRRQLALEHPDLLDFKADLAMSLSNLGNHLHANDVSDEAVSALEDSIRLRRELAAVQPQVYQPGLALSLSNLSFVLVSLKRGEEAFETAGAALRLLAPFLEDRPSLREQAELALTNYRAAAAAAGRETDPDLEAIVGT